MMSRFAHLKPAAWLALLGLAFIASGCGPQEEAGTDAGTYTGAGGSGTKRFIFLTNGDDPFWDACNAGLQEGA